MSRVNLLGRLLLEVVITGVIFFCLTTYVEMEKKFYQLQIDNTLKSQRHDFNLALYSLLAHGDLPIDLNRVVPSHHFLFIAENESKTLSIDSKAISIAPEFKEYRESMDRLRLVNPDVLMTINREISTRIRKNDGMVLFSLQEYALDLRKILKNTDDEKEVLKGFYFIVNYPGILSAKRDMDDLYNQEPRINLYYYITFIVILALFVYRAMRTFKAYSDLSSSMNSVNAYLSISDDIMTVHSRFEQWLGQIEGYSSSYNQLMDQLGYWKNESLKNIEKFNQLRNLIQESSKRIKRLGESIQKIHEITDSLSDIADTSQVLAINASVQSNFNGESGRGFRAVAMEIEKLSERTEKYLKTTTHLISTVHGDVQAVMESIENLTQGVVSGLENTQSSEHEFIKIMQRMEKQGKYLLTEQKEGEHLHESMTRLVTLMEEVNKNLGYGYRDVVESENA